MMKNSQLNRIPSIAATAQVDCAGRCGNDPGLCGPATRRHPNLDQARPTRPGRLRRGGSGAHLEQRSSQSQAAREGLVHRITGPVRFSQDLGMTRTTASGQATL